jgi:uncharacterized membrane protein (DUF373 family)
MTIRGEIAAAREKWRSLTFYEKFEHLVVLILTVLIAIVVAAAVWNLLLRILYSVFAEESLDPTEHAVFQTIFGMIFTVIIALEFNRSLVVMGEHHASIIHVRTVVLLAMLAILRKLIILDLAATDGFKLLGLSVAMLALGVIYWLVGEQDRHLVSFRLKEAKDAGSIDKDSAQRR